MSSRLRFAFPFLLLAFTGVGCGRSPAAAPAGGPSGTLVIVIKQGPERVSFHPKVARIQRANQQIASILGHSIEIELDGALLPQTHEESEDVIARLVEAVARDLDGLKKQDEKALAYARTSFEKLTVRYSPTEAATRETSSTSTWSRRGMAAAKLDPKTKSIDVTRSEARWLAIERGEIATPLYRAFAAGQDDRYGNVLPDALSSANERRAWFDYHAHGTHSGQRGGVKIGSVDPLVTIGMVSLAKDSSGDGDAALRKDARDYVFEIIIGNFATTYHHHQADVEAAPQGSPFRQAESTFTNFVRSEMAKLTIDERGRIGSHLWVYDFRKNSADRDRFATYAFPGIDPMQFGFDTVDAWIAAGHPTTFGRAHYDPFEIVVSPVTWDTERNGAPHFNNPGRSSGEFYKWAFSNRTREDAFVKGLTQRVNDEPFVAAAFYHARRAFHDENEYLRLLRRFESMPLAWGVGVDVYREAVYRPSPALLEESRRLWREVQHSRPRVLLWFARHGDGSYHPEVDWPDMVQGSPADDVVLDKFLALGWEAFEILPAAWAGVAKSNGRVRVMTKHANMLFSQEVQTRPGGHGIAGTMAAVARILCEDGRTTEVAELRAYAQAELPKRPGVGLSDIVEATDPANCKPRKSSEGGHKLPFPTPAKKKALPKDPRQ